MKTFKRYQILAMLLLASTVLFSCKDDDNNDPEPDPENTIADLVVENQQFSLLRAAVTRAGLEEMLAGEGPYTVFAPNNAAFAASGLDQDAINALPVETLKAVLSYHVVGRTIRAEDIPTAANTVVKTASDQDFYVTKDGESVSVNGANVSNTDITASNGVIHVLDRVLFPPAENLVETLTGEADFSLLIAAVMRASEGSTDAAEVLNSAGPFTVFAPNNEAFAAAGFATEEAIQAANPETLLNILTYHVVTGRVFSTNLSDGDSPETLNGENLTIAIGDDVSVKGEKNDSPAKVVRANWTTTNGVIHVVDQVLLP